MGFHGRKRNIFVVYMLDVHSAQIVDFSIIAAKTGRQTRALDRRIYYFD